jgi:tRNA(Ile)-lysidine synthase
MGICLFDAIKRGERVLAAVSGGADSIALLTLLNRARGRGDISVVAAHFEHGIRGARSTGDASFVRELCVKLDIPLIEGNADTPSVSADLRKGLELAARDLRYDFLMRAKAQAGADVIALAHHMDDQAETVLMHMFRGSGLHGIIGMRKRQGDLARPLLNARKRELIEFLTEIGQDWREDETNLMCDTPRNYLRLKVFPLISAAYPRAVQAISRFSQVASDEDELLNTLAHEYMEKWMTPLPNGIRLNLEPRPHRAVLRRVLLHITRADFNSAERLTELVRARRGATEIPGGGRAEVTGGHIYILNAAIAPPPKPIPLREGVNELPRIGALTVEKTDSVQPITGDPYCQRLDLDALRGAVIRTREPGDFIRPLGLSGSQKLSDYFINRRVDRPLRDYIMLVARGREVMWAVGAGISETAALKPGSRAIKLTHSGIRFI